MHGDGIYRRPDYDTFWITYKNADGRRVRENTKTTDRQRAKRLRDERVGRVARGEHLDPRRDKTTYGEARAVLLNYYALAGREAPLPRLAHLDPFFSSTKLTDIKTARVEAYRMQRTQAGAAGATINPEGLGLITPLRVAHRRELLHAPPPPKGLQARQGQKPTRFCAEL